MSEIINRLRKRAEIRRQISTRKSVQEGATDRIADLLDEAANEISELNELLAYMFYQHCSDLDGPFIYDHMCLSANENAQDYLIKIGKIKTEDCRRK